MRYYAVLVVALFSFYCSKAQLNCEIIFDGSGAAAKVDKVDMFDLSQQEYYSQPYSKTVHFSFKKKQIDTYWIVYFCGEKRIRQQIWLDTGNIKIVAHADSFRLVIDTVYNSPFYYRPARVFSTAKKMLQEKDTAAANTFLLDEYKRNAQNPFSVFVADQYLKINQLNKARMKPLKELMDTYGEQLRWFVIYDNVKEKVDKLVVESFLDLNEFDFTGSNGKPVKATFNTAEYAVLDFWFLLCAPCIADHKIIAKNITLLRNKGIEMIGLSTDNAIKPWKQYLIRNKYNWQNLLVGQQHKLYTKLNIQACPSYVIVSKDGEIKAIYSQFSDVLTYFGIKSN